MPLVEGAASFTSPLSALIFFYMHGAATRPLPTETAFAARRRAVGFRCDRSVVRRRNVRPAVAWVRALWTRFEPHLLGRAYVNHLAADDRPETIRASFGENYSAPSTGQGGVRPNESFPHEREHPSGLGSSNDKLSRLSAPATCSALLHRFAMLPIPIRNYFFAGPKSKSQERTYPTEAGVEA